MYTEYRCKNASEPPPVDETTLQGADPPTSNPSSSSSKFNKTPSGPRIETETETETEAETEEVPSDHMAMPSDSMAMPGDAIAAPIALWEWMERYASFQVAAQSVMDALRAKAHLHNIDHHHKCLEAGLRTWESLKSAAPVNDLECCSTRHGATWQQVVHWLDQYFQAPLLFFDHGELMLGGWPATFPQMLGAMCQLIKQLLNWYLNECDDEEMNACVSALVCFNEESKKLGGSARCHLKDDSFYGRFTVVIQLTGYKPEYKYTNRTLPTWKQMETGVLQSQQSRSEGLRNIAEGIGKRRKRKR